MDGVARPELSGALVPASATTKSQVWSVVVTPDGGIATGDSVTLTAVIANAAPVVSSFGRDQEVVLVVTPSDATETGTPSSVSLRVGNTPPGAPVVTISPSEPRGGDALTCAVVGDAVDPDGDAVT